MLELWANSGAQGSLRTEKEGGAQKRGKSKQGKQQSRARSQGEDDNDDGTTTIASLVDTCTQDAARPVLREGQKGNLLAVFAAALSCFTLGVVCGILGSGYNCESTAWWNPVAAIYSLWQAERNPFLMIFAPDSVNAIRVAYAGAVSGALGAVGLVTHQKTKRKGDKRNGIGNRLAQRKRLMDEYEAGRCLEEEDEEREEDQTQEDESEREDSVSAVKVEGAERRVRGGRQ